MDTFFFPKFPFNSAIALFIGVEDCDKDDMTKRALNFCYFQMLRNTLIPEAPMFKPEFPPQGLFLSFSFLVSSVDTCILPSIPC